MMKTLKEQVQSLPKGQYAEIGFDQFQADPMGELSRVYSELDLGEFSEDSEQFSAYLEIVMCAGLGFFVYAHFTKETFPILDCERHEMFIGDERIVGVEDLAFDAVENEIYFSAYDRRAGTVGGLYRFSALDVSGIEKLKTPNAPLTPHGFDLTRRGSELSMLMISFQGRSPIHISSRTTTPPAHIGDANLRMFSPQIVHLFFFLI